MRLVLFIIWIWPALLFGEDVTGTRDGETRRNPERQEPENLKVPIPEELRAGGYSLRIDGKDLDLGKTTAEFRPTLEEVNVELFDRHGRLVDNRSQYVDNNIFDDVGPQNFTAALSFGGSHSQTRGRWRKAFLTGDRFQMMGEFGYQFGPLGLKGHIGFQSESNSYEEGFTASYGMTMIGAMLNYEFAPFRSRKSYLGKLLVSPLVGPFLGLHTASLDDGEVKTAGSDTSFGLNIGGEIKYPIYNNFYLQNRFFTSFQRIQIPEVGLSVSSPQHNMLFGGGFAF